MLANYTYMLTRFRNIHGLRIHDNNQLGRFGIYLKLLSQAIHLQSNINNTIVLMTIIKHII